MSDEIRHVGAGWLEGSDDDATGHTALFHNGTEMVNQPAEWAPGRRTGDMDGGEYAAQ